MKLCILYFQNSYPKKGTSKKGEVGKILTTLFELDASSLGLNVIWCSDYSEIPDILMKIAKQ